MGVGAVGDDGGDAFVDLEELAERPQPVRLLLDIQRGREVGIADPRVGVPRHHVAGVEVNGLVDGGGAAGGLVVVEVGNEARFGALARGDVEADDPALVLVMYGIDVRDNRPRLLFHQFVAKLRYGGDVRFLQQGLLFVPVNRHDFSLSARRPESGVLFHSTLLAGTAFFGVGLRRRWTAG